MLNIPPGINHDEALENEARRLERERIYDLLLATNPMDVSICDPIHGDQWIAVALYDLIQPK